MRLLRRRKRTERCETCGAHLTFRQAVEVTAHGYGTTEIGPGGYSISAVYCRRHAPKEDPHAS